MKGQMEKIKLHFLVWDLFPFNPWRWAFVYYVMRYDRSYIGVLVLIHYSFLAKQWFRNLSAEQAAMIFLESMAPL